MDELPQFQRSQMAKYDGKQGEFAAWWLCLQDGFKCSAPMSQDNQLLNAKALLQGTARQTSDDAERVARILTAGGGPPLMEAWAEKMAEAYGQDPNCRPQLAELRLDGIGSSHEHAGQFLSLLKKGGIVVDQAPTTGAAEHGD